MSASRHSTLGYTAGIVPLAVVVLDFDPLLRVGDGLVVRWATVALAAVVALSIVVGGLVGRARGLRADDLLYIAIGIVPGAVIGGRIGYGLLHFDTFGGNPSLLLDVGHGGLELGCAVAGGALTGAYVAALLGVPVGRWAHTSAGPFLLAIGLGKFAMILGGSGQGLPSDVSWATSFVGPGPWGSLAPSLPSHPSQAYEGLAALGILVVLALVVAAGGFGRRDGRLLLLAITEWALARAAISLTWRDAVVVGPLNVGALIALGLAIGATTLLVIVSIRARRTAGASATSLEPAWPDPATRPRF